MALDHVHGEWICFLGADDYFWNSNVIEDIVEYIDENPTECRVLYGRVKAVDNKGNVLFEFGKPWKETRRFIRESLTFCHTGTFHHVHLFKSMVNLMNRLKSQVT
jgi:hypothetical protein